MKTSITAALSRTLAAAALCAVGAAHAAPEDWQAVAASCTPTTPSALSGATLNASNNGAIRANTGDGTLKYVCNVLDSYVSSVTVNWTRFRLQALDPVGGAVGAQLYAKNKTTGAVTLVATVVANVPVANVQNYAVPIPALNFDAFAYHVVITLNRQAAAQPAAHMVSLTLQ